MDVARMLETLLAPSTLLAFSRGTGLFRMDRLGGAKRYCKELSENAKKKHQKLESEQDLTPRPLAPSTCSS
uniref:Uncharacterized protein n=1 Tax=Pristionchus pacificus TaxID=54126 RepID=A0A2A6BWU6_PRIPA|eukprot:PDM70384.1 hypothetical protein PRIPAC_46630 [Pristionchus pacificus]